MLKKAISVKSVTKKNLKENGLVFIIMPFGEWFDTYYEDIYCKAIEKVKLKHQRLDDSDLPVALVQEMFDTTRKAKIVLADLTGNNPNVCYELGLAHALDKPAIIITDSIENIPFDVSAFRIIVYDKNDPNWGDKLKQKLINSLEAIVSNPSKSLPSRLLRATENAEDENRADIIPRIDLIERERLLNRLAHGIDINSHDRPQGIRTVNPRLRIEPDEAGALIESYLKRKTPLNFIISRLVRLGAPRSWIIDRIESINKRKKLKSKIKTEK